MGNDPILPVSQTRVRTSTLWSPLIGVPPRTRTLTDGFGDRGAAITPGIRIGGDGEIRTHGPICMSRQVSNLLPSATRPRHLKLVRPAGLEPAKAASYTHHPVPILCYEHSGRSAIFHLRSHI